MSIHVLPLAPSVASVSNIPVSRKFFRWIKSCVLRHEGIYRLLLKLRYGADHAAKPSSAELPNGTLQGRSDWRDATRLARTMGLPLHRAEEKNWDHLAAVRAIASHTTKSAYVLDAGAEIYSNVLPALFVHGYRHLYGVNLSFSRPARRGPIQYLPGDITKTDFSDETFDAVSCMSVIEHGVPVDAYFREMFRILKPGGLLITSTDYFPDPIDTKGQTAHGAPIRIFSKPEIEAILAHAQACGFELTGEVDLECVRRPIHWQEYDLEFTFLIFTLRKPARRPGRSS
jgi:SAM-dependent methyltransferase